MGALLGLTFGLGLLLIWRSALGPRRSRGTRRGPRVLHRIADMIAEAGIEAVTPRQVVASCAGAGLFVALGPWFSQTWPIALAFGVFAAYAPIALLRYRVRQRRGELRDVWPDAVDNLASAVRAGLSLPEALTQLGVRGPVVLRVPFLRFGEDYRASGRFNECRSAQGPAGRPDGRPDLRVAADRS